MPGPQRPVDTMYSWLHVNSRGFLALVGPSRSSSEQCTAEQMHIFGELVLSHNHIVLPMLFISTSPVYYNLEICWGIHRAHSLLLVFAVIVQSLKCFTWFCDCLRQASKFSAYCSTHVGNRYYFLYFLSRMHVLLAFIFPFDVKNVFKSWCSVLLL